MSDKNKSSSLQRVRNSHPFPLFLELDIKSTSDEIKDSQLKYASILEKITFKKSSLKKRTI